MVPKIFLKGTILHEIGHSLGITEMNFESEINVMKQGIKSITKLGPYDIGVYRKCGDNLWEEKEFI